MTVIGHICSTPNCNNRMFLGESTEQWWTVDWLEFNVRFQHKYSYIRDENDGQVGNAVDCYAIGCRFKHWWGQNIKWWAMKEFKNVVGIYSHKLIIIMLLSVCMCSFCFVLIKLQNVHSVPWQCWMGGREAIRPVKTEWWGSGVVIIIIIIIISSSSSN